MESYYLWLKAAHIISLIAWMVGILYLPRLYVYHVGAKKNGELDKTLQVMERKLYYYITTPAMIATLIFGILLIMSVGMVNLGGWFHIKMALLLGLLGVHGILGRYRRLFASGKNQHSAKFYRILNEVPTLLLIVIVFLAVIKPF